MRKTMSLLTLTKSFLFSSILVIFVTAAGNILVCLAIARERKLQNTTNYFLMSLAVADCLVAILVMPMGMIAEVLGKFSKNQEEKKTNS
jgi:5-hydroxytryptamine receptor 2